MLDELERVIRRDLICVPHPKTVQGEQNPQNEMFRNPRTPTTPKRLRRAHELRETESPIKTRRLGPGGESGDIQAGFGHDLNPQLAPTQEESET